MIYFLPFFLQANASGLTNPGMHELMKALEWRVYYYSQIWLCGGFCGAGGGSFPTHKRSSGVDASFFFFLCLLQFAACVAIDLVLRLSAVC